MPEDGSEYTVDPAVMQLSVLLSVFADAHVSSRFDLLDPLLLPDCVDDCRLLRSERTLALCAAVIAQIPKFATLRYICLAGIVTLSVTMT